MNLALRLLLLSLPAVPSAAGSFDFRDGDRVVLIGGTLVEREQKFGLLETRLALALGERRVSVRNLGWSGDTVFGAARSYFGPPEEGIERLSRHIETLRPTVLLSCYGHDVALDRDADLAAFITGYGALLDLARSKCPGLRIAVIAPPPFENLGPPLPDMTAANARLDSVRGALREFAARQGTAFVDTFELMGGARKERPVEPLTDNGIHYAEAGYQAWTERLLTALGVKAAPLAPAEIEPLRRAVIRKDFLFFNRWRPANETYLFGFRKHEQGQNAVEMEQFDPLVSEAEQKITRLKSAALASKKLP